MRQDSPIVVQLPRLGWWVLALIVLLPWAAVLWLARPSPEVSKAPPPKPTAAPGPELGTPPQLGNAGPWGQLEYSRIVIEPPEDFVPSFFTQPQPFRWVFRGLDEAQLEALWQRAGLTDDQRHSLRSARRQAFPEGVVLEPDADLILSLTPEARTAIYGVLAAWTENPVQHDPFRSRRDAVDDWFEPHALPEEIISLTRRLLYPRNGNMLFSDHDIVLPKLSSAAQRVVFIKALSRKSTFLINLRVAPGADVEALTRYWGRGRRSKDVGPLLRSLAQRPGGGSIDVAHLLPPLPRTLLYTYPLPSDDPVDLAHDCHWTSFNFYNDRPDERLAEMAFVERVIQSDYFQAAGEPAFGDVIILVDQQGKGVHSCVYLADDFVFTKNGGAFSVPWLLGRLETVVSFYSIGGTPLEVRRYRKRE